MSIAYGPYRSDERSDEELLQAYRECGEQEVLAVLYERHLAFLLGVCNKYLKDEEASRDAVMEIYEKLVEALKEKEVEKVKPWLYTVAKNHCLMRSRKKRARDNAFDPSELMESDIMRSGGELHPFDEDEREKHLKWLEECLEILKEEQRTCVDSFFLKGRSYKSVAAETGFGIEKVRSHIQNGKRNLSNCMKEKYERQAG